MWAQAVLMRSMFDFLASSWDYVQGWVMNSASDGRIMWAVAAALILIIVRHIRMPRA